MMRWVGLVFLVIACSQEPSAELQTLQRTAETMLPADFRDGAIAASSNLRCRQDGSKLTCARCGYTITVDPEVGLIFEPYLMLAKADAPSGKTDFDVTLDFEGRESAVESSRISVELARDMINEGRQWCAARNYNDLYKHSEDYSVIAEHAD